MDTKQKETLEKYAKGDDITAQIAQDALDHEGYELGYLRDVTQHGCVSGTCSGLIYYADTHAFYMKHADECDDVLNEFEEMTGEAFKFEGRDVRNTLAWMGYEEKARNLLDELEPEA